MKTTLYASDYAKLDSNIITGGGTDDTDVLQGLLDKALEWGHLTLILDGAALVRGLDVHSNTTIICPDAACGLYLADNCDRAVLRNSNRTFGEIKTKNVTIQGGTYNHNCLHQVHHVNVEGQNLGYQHPNEDGEFLPVIAMEFYGIENLTVRDIKIRDMRTYAFCAGNFKRVTIENTWFELENVIEYGNQDGFHFWGPGQFLTVKNVGGRTEDDFMNIGSDERDGFSSLTDVTVDGVYLDHAWQAIRLLSCGTGLLDRVTVRNVTGTVGFPFYVNTWEIYKNKLGNFGNIIIENVDLKLEPCPALDMVTPYLFRIGGNIESLTLRNIAWHDVYDGRTPIWVGYLRGSVTEALEELPRIKNFTVDGIRIVDTGEKPNTDAYMMLRGKIDRVTVRNAEVVRNEQDSHSGCLIKTLDQAKIDRILVDLPDIENLDSVLDLTKGETEQAIIRKPIFKNIDSKVKATPDTQTEEI